MTFRSQFLTGYFLKPRKTPEAQLRRRFAGDAAILERTARFDILFRSATTSAAGDKIFQHRGGHRSEARAGRLQQGVSRGYSPPPRVPRVREARPRLRIVICADADTIEPARILAWKGARVIFAPHFKISSTIRWEH